MSDSAVPVSLRAWRSAEYLVSGDVEKASHTEAVAKEL